MERVGRPHFGARRRGMTLLELLIALSITAVVGLAIAAVTTAIARGMESMSAGRSALQRTVAAHARLRMYVHPARCFLSADPERGFAVWLSDTRTNGRVNLSELRVFWFDPDDQTGDLTVEWADFPDDWDDQTVVNADTELTSVDDYFAAMESLRALGHTGSAVLADGLASIGVAHSGQSLQQSERVRVSMGVDVGEGQPREVLMSFGLPSHAVPE